jgi:hypothetical protein
MKLVCQACHGQNWIEAHFRRFDRAVRQYNRVYYKPAKKMLDLLYARKLVDKKKMLDEHLEVEFYELWHHKGRRARMGAAMMAPDYTWWHGFYECKKSCLAFMRHARALLKHSQPDLKDLGPQAAGSIKGSPELIPIRGRRGGGHD